MEKVGYDFDIFASVKDLFVPRRKREIDTYNENNDVKMSVFDYLKDSSADGKCKVSDAKKDQGMIKKRKKRNVFASRKHFSNEFVREKRRAEKDLVELQHKMQRCNKYMGENAEQCREMNERFQLMVKEINEKFHQFDYDTFEGNQESSTKKMKSKENSAHLNEVIDPKDKHHHLQKSNEIVGQAFFGDGLYSYSYDKIPKFHEDLHESADGHKRNLKTVSRNGEFQNQRPEIVTSKDDPVKTIPVKVPEPTGEILSMMTSDMKLLSKIMFCKRCKWTILTVMRAIISTTARKQFTAIWSYVLQPSSIANDSPCHW